MYINAIALNVIDKVNHLLYKDEITQKKLGVVCMNMQKDNIAIFNRLADISKLNNTLYIDTAQHSEKLQRKFQLYLSYICGDDQSLVRNLYQLSAEKVKKSC